MEQLDKEVIEHLSEPARRVFKSLDYCSQRRMLKQAKEMASREKLKRQQKGYVKKRNIKKKDKKKKKSEERGSSSKRRAASFAFHESKKLMIESLHLLLLGSSVADDSYEGKHAGHMDDKPVTISKESARKTTRTTINGVKFLLRKNWQKKVQRKAAKQTMERSAHGMRMEAKSATKVGQFLAKTMQTIVPSIVTNPVVWIAILIIIVIAIIVGAIGAIIGSGGAVNESQDYTYQAQVSEQTESYRDLVSNYCEKYGIDDYVDLCLAMIEQESGGNGSDVMQTEQSYYNINPPIDSAEESIDCGTHELSDCLTKANCKSPNDIKGISLALQGYNFGNGYVEWALKNYGGYTKENVEIFSKKMCKELGYDSYGDVAYVAHVLRYYVENPETSISNESAKSILKELKENNSASSERWKVIEKGASLIGAVQYSMEKRQGDGRDKPEFLDCSSFEAWAFHKSGITSVPYSSTTATFIDSKKFVDIGGDELQPGDIGLKSKTGGTGGANHVGIYAGKMKNGTVVWLHCTSSSSSSLTGNTDGVMFGAYTNFTYFRRLKKWNK